MAIASPLACSYSIQEGKIALHLARHADIAVSDKQLEMGQVTVESIQTARGASNNDKARRPITNAADSIKEISTALQLSTIKESSGKKEGKHAIHLPLHDV